MDNSRTLSRHYCHQMSQVSPPVLQKRNTYPFLAVVNYATIHTIFLVIIILQQASFEQSGLQCWRQRHCTKSDERVLINAHYFGLKRNLRTCMNILVPELIIARGREGVCSVEAILSDEGMSKRELLVTGRLRGR